MKIKCHFDLSDLCVFAENMENGEQWWLAGASLSHGNLIPGHEKIIEIDDPSDIPTGKYLSQIEKT